MKYIFLFFLLCVLYKGQAAETAEKEICENGKLRCYQTEYKDYVKCIEKQRSKRNVCGFAQSVAPQVAQIATPPCTGQSCTYIQPVQPAPCLTTCQSACSNVGCRDQCQQTCQPQAITSPCVSTCQASCGGVACQDRCQASCQIPTIQQVQAVQPVQPIQPVQPVQPGQPHIITITGQQGTPLVQPSSPNVTTVIKLTNIVNNTNVVNVPTSINNTNVNNIDLSSNASHAGSAESRRCCAVVQPRVCERVPTGYRCIHRKHHTCGPQCGSQVVHAQIRQPCNSSGQNCRAQVAYVPQPNPRCVYQQNWPYVSCGQKQTSSCAGCYDHYGYGYQRYWQGAGQPQCSGCYDDGYSNGPLYRQGPFYRPGYYHTPPCYLTGSCYMQQPTMPMNCGYGGCYGHELIDPAFGMQSYSPYSTSPYYGMANNYAPAAPNYVVPNYAPMVPSYGPPIPMSSYAPYYPYPGLYPVIPEIQASNGTVPFPDNNNNTVIQPENEIDENAIIPDYNPYYRQPYPMTYYSPYASPYLVDTLNDINETVKNPESVPASNPKQDVEELQSPSKKKTG